MERREFDKFADEYLAAHRQNVRISGEEPEFFHRYKVDDVGRIWHQSTAALPREPVRILDFGTGIGNSLPHFWRNFPTSYVVGIDVSSRSLEIARGRGDRRTGLVLCDGAFLPFDRGTFDLAFAACVFHHIDHLQHVALLAEIRRVLRPDGLFVLFEHNPLNPLTVYAVRTCPFDEDARLISGPKMSGRFEKAGFGDVRLAYRLFFPRQLKMLRPLEKQLGWLPLGAQYCVSGRPM